jgi:hypothetical protein
MDPVGLPQLCLRGALCIADCTTCPMPPSRRQIGWSTWRSGTEEPPKCYHVAIDDGQTDVAVKYEIGEGLFTALRYGNRLRLDVTPRLRCVKAAQVLPAACEEAPVTTGT